jgi:hypothetical protein
MGAAAIEQYNALQQFGSNVFGGFGAGTQLGGSGSAGSLIRNASALGSFSGVSAGGATVAAGGAVTSAMSGSGIGGVGGVAIGGGGGDTINKTVIVNQTFLQPPDPLTISKGIEFELGAAI